MDKTKKVTTINSVTTNPVEICRALGDAIRWRIVRLAAHDALCVCELADILEMPQSSVSSHVQVIRKAGLLESEKCEKWTYFRIEARYLKLFRLLEAEAAPDLVWASDDRKASKRLSERAGSCCPGPKRLARSRRPQSLLS
jgi:DNA-binding transcriptional ArsR family regulator